MARSKAKAEAPVTDVTPQVTADSVGGEAPTEFRGRDEKGNVRPADDRFLSEEQIAARDAYVAEVTGPEAQQLVVKREAAEADGPEVA